jgi:hypothetical protein
VDYLLIGDDAKWEREKEKNEVEDSISSIVVIDMDRGGITWCGEGGRGMMRMVWDCGQSCCVQGFLCQP